MENAHQYAPAFPNPKTHPMAGRILFSLLLRQRVSPKEVGLGADVPRYLVHLRELEALGWRMYAASIGPSGWRQKTDGSMELCAPGGWLGDEAGRFANYMVRTPAGAAWVEAMSAEVLAGCAR